jgi:hypothetical protein
MIEMQRSDKISLRRYLLGEADPEEQSTIEQRLLSEQEYFDELIKTEEELTDEYVRGELEGAEKKDFELRFVAHPERRERVEFARVLNQYLSGQGVAAGAGPGSGGRPFAVHREDRDEKHARGRSSAPWRAVAGLAACFLLVVTVGSAFLWRQGQRLQEQIAQFELQRSQSEQHQQELVRQIEQQVAQNNALTVQFERQQDELSQLRRELARLLPVQPETIASLLLAPGLSRSPDQASVAVVSPSVQKLRLSLQVGGERYRSYRAEVQTVEGTIVASEDNLKSHESGNSRAVTLVLSTAPLTRSDYLVMLDGISNNGSAEKVGTYYFKLIRKS